jgi:protein SCO1
VKTNVAVILVAAIAAFAYGFWVKTSSLSVDVHRVPAVTVVDDRGQRIAFRDEIPAIVFFGYTRCRDACPLELARLAKKPERVVFVTIDPAYDKPMVLARYVKQFGSNVVGVTGDTTSIERLYGAFTGAPSLPSRPQDHDAQAFDVNATGEIAAQN